MNVVQVLRILHLNSWNVLTGLPNFSLSHSLRYSGSNPFSIFLFKNLYFFLSAAPMSNFFPWLSRSHIISNQHTQTYQSFFFFYLQHTHLTLASILSVPNILLTCGHIIPFSLYPSDWHLNKRNSLQLKTKTKTSYINVYVIHIFLQLMSDFSLPPHTRILQRAMFTGCFHLFLLAHSSMHSHYSTKTLFAEVISDFHMVQCNEHFKSSQQSWMISSFLKHVSDVTQSQFFSYFSSRLSPLLIPIFLLSTLYILGHFRSKSWAFFLPLL